MIYKKVAIFLFIIFSMLPTQYTFAQTQNVGIIPSNIWYSKDPFQEGDKIKIYTVVYNTDPRELSGTVIFFDNNVFLGKTDFSIAGKSTNDVSVSWTVTAGDHTIFAKIENAKFLISSGKYEDVYLAENQTNESKKTVIKKEIVDLPNNIANKVSDSTSSVSNVVQTVKDNTPPFITKTLDYTAGSLENIRIDVGDILSSKKENVQKEIDVLNNTKTDTEKDIMLDNTTIKEKIQSPETTNFALKPFKYVELFFLTIFLFIFKYMILFYGLIILILFLILRFLWRLIF